MFTNFTDLQEAFVIALYQPLMWLFVFIVLGAVVGTLHLAAFVAYQKFLLRKGGE